MRSAERAPACLRRPNPGLFEPCSELLRVRVAASPPPEARAVAWCWFTRRDRSWKSGHRPWHGRSSRTAGASAGKAATLRPRLGAPRAERCRDTASGKSMKRCPEVEKPSAAKPMGQRSTGSSYTGLCTISNEWGEHRHNSVQVGRMLDVGQGAGRLVAMVASVWIAILQVARAT